MSRAPFCFPSDFPYDIQPSWEAEEDFFAALSRRLTHHHLPVNAAPFPRTNHAFKQTPLPKHRASNRAPHFAHQTGNVKCTPPLQHNNRPHFSGSAGSSVKTGCAGTGVFLPRHYQTPPHSRNKTGSAPVLLPAKVVHALNFNMHQFNGAPHHRFFNAFAADYEAALARRNALLMQQRLTLLRPEEAANYETRLPQEWTY
ncbi:uncharacterized protein LOC109790055 [Cajanus cajan]|uniref:uncharacterized protein LOC109790055 n=1 Tax=Cajanus cajan TaxID=3821 RepID=UPI00098DAF9A|nr:uncharacterized protein LOC109790055 [Cajanus cajan]